MPHPFVGVIQCISLSRQQIHDRDFQVIVRLMKSLIECKLTLLSQPISFRDSMHLDVIVLMIGWSLGSSSSAESSD